MGKRTPPLACTPENCGDNYPRCGKANTYNYHKCRCEPCRAAKSEEHRRHYEKHQEKVKAQANAYSHANAETILPKQKQYYEATKTERLETCRQWREANRDRKAATDKRWREANKGWLTDYFRQYRLDNPEVERESKRRRKARKQNGQVFKITQRDIQRLLHRHNYACFYCGSKDNLSIDHIIPLNREGYYRESIGNLIPACRSCNSSKCDSTIMEWRLGLPAPSRTRKYRAA